ncbi:DNA-processing protein DprA [Halobaculum sp. MBLA0147]|uniref:DNA-processing protein DprA n=1 Tax=Halobaculum sp. MBLA0147 TaxID=3079934 RepID=UPI003525813B
MRLTDKALLAALTDVSGIGDTRAYELYNHFDDPWDLLSAPGPLTDKYHYIDETTLASIQSLDDEVEDYINLFNEYISKGIKILSITEDRYPEAVCTSPAPVLLYAKGNVEILTGNTVGVSGSRETNRAGQQWIGSLSAELAEKGYTLVSGGARGADTAAHQGALDVNGSTIVVLGTGVNVAYPPENQSLFDQVIDTGGLLISMRLPDAEPVRHAFLDRNELIAALSDRMIFVATDGNGGTMAQYKIACEQDRPIFVPPPGLDVAPNDGLATIREANAAKSITTASELLGSSLTKDAKQKNLNEWT